jgi:WD40 repeat protein
MYIKKRLHLIFTLLLVLLLINSCGQLRDEVDNSISKDTSSESETKVELTPSPTQKPKQVGDLSSLLTISLENVDQLKKLDSLQGHTKPAGVVFSPDGEVLATYSGDRSSRLWDLSTGHEFASFTHFQPVMALAFNPDGTMIATGCADEIVRLWDTKTGAELVAYKGHRAGIGWQSIAWSPDGTMVASGDREGIVKIWEISTDSEIVSLQSHYDDVTGISFSPDGSLLATASEDLNIQIWDVATFSMDKTLLGHASDVGDIAFNPDGNMLASISGDITVHDKTVRLWDINTGEQIISMDGHERSWYGDVSFSPDGSLLISSGGVINDGTIHIYSVETGELLNILKGEANGIIGVTFNPDGNLIASGSNDGIIELWGVK